MLQPHGNSKEPTPIPSAEGAPSTATGINPAHLARVSARKAALKSLLPDVIPAGSESAALEIGCGHGHFLTQYASDHPDQFCLGIDILADRLRRADKKRERAGVENLKFIKAEAGEFLDLITPGTRFSDIFILFPDPWPKKRHHKNRLIQNAFLTLLAETMTPAGRIHFRTDHPEYFAWTKKMIEDHALWVIDRAAPWLQNEATVFQTKATRFESLVAKLKTRD